MQQQSSASLSSIQAPLEVQQLPSLSGLLRISLLSNSIFHSDFRVAVPAVSLLVLD